MKHFAFIIFLLLFSNVTSMQKFKQENSKKMLIGNFSTASEITEEINDEKNKNWKKVRNLNVNI